MIACNLLQAYVRLSPIEKGKHHLVATTWRRVCPKGTDLVTRLQDSHVLVSCDLNWHIQRHLYFWGAYERDECRYWARLAERSATIFDIGANVGLYSLVAASSNPSARIHAFEPTSHLVRKIETNIALNRFQNILVNALGVGSTSGRGHLHECLGNEGSNEGMNYVSGSNLESKPGIEVPMVTLDDYCQAQKINQIDLMKVDIEGGEYDAFAGARNLLAEGRISCIFVELMEWAAVRYGRTTAAIKSLLHDAGYQMFFLNDGNLRAVDLGTEHNGENIISFRPGFDPLLPFAR
jgi:FkbM family methyltransferase